MNRFATAVPDTLQPLAEACATLLFDANPAVRDHAAREWCAWEDAHVSLTPGRLPNPRYQDPEFRLRFARLALLWHIFAIDRLNWIERSRCRGN